MSHKASHTTMNFQHANWRPEHHSKRREDRLYKQFLNNASQRLSFSEEVMYEMGAISYTKLDFSWLFHVTGPLAPCTRLKKIRKHGNKKMKRSVNPLTQEELRISVQAPAVNTKASFTNLSDQSKMHDVFRKTKPFRVLNVQTCLKESNSEDWESQSSVWEQEFAQSKTSDLLQLRKQRRRKKYRFGMTLGKPGYVLSPVSSNVQNHLNKTASTVTVKHIEIPQAPRLQDILNPLAGSHVTENVLKQEIFSGRAVKAEQQWVDQPARIDCALKQVLRPPDFSGQDSEMSKQSLDEHSSLRYAVDKWRRACNVKLPLQSVNIEGLKRALSDPNYTVRLEAILTCASRAVNGPQEELHPGKTAQDSKELQELRALIVSALEDPVKRVQMAAAVCQYAMRTPNAHARDILRNMIKQDPSGTGADSWVAAQCLAIDGDASQAVIQRLLSQHFLRGDQEQSMTLLSNISSKTTLVRSLLAEELNSANWKTRLKACSSIAQLRSPINKDLCNKLKHMMWNDWSSAVRHAAALALSELSAAREMHSELSAKLEEGPNPWRVEALILIGRLKIMPPKLLPTFLRCFNDDFVTVRKQACLTAASLMMEDQSILDQLINLVQNEPIWEVKVEAINALKKIGWMNPTLQELLMWAVHHEEEPSVRIAACKALSTLDSKGPELQLFLQERYALEPNDEVQRHIKGLLKKYGYSLQGDESKVHEIKLQMELLCTKNITTQKVLLLDEMGKQQQQ